MSCKQDFKKSSKSRYLSRNRFRKEKFALNYNFLENGNNDYEKKLEEDDDYTSNDLWKKLMAIDSSIIMDKLPEIKSILKDKVILKDNIFSDSTVYNKKDKFRSYINRRIRDSKKVVLTNRNRFKKEYEKISEIIKDILEKDLIEKEEIVISNHIDILKYKPGGFFRPHRDDLTLPEMQKYNNLGYDILTLIICIDSKNKIPESCATVVWKNEQNNEPYYIYKENLPKRHLFPTGIEGNGLLFDGSLLHQVNHSVSETIIKLKVDVYINNLYDQDYCGCCLCYNNPDYTASLRRKKLFYSNRGPLINNEEVILDDNIISIISGFLGKLKRCCCSNKIESNFDFECRCNCDDCQNNCRYDDYDYEYDSDSHCNGDMDYF